MHGCLVIEGEVELEVVAVIFADIEAETGAVEDVELKPGPVEFV